MKENNHKTKKTVLLLLVVISLAVLIYSPLIGIEKIPFNVIFNDAHVNTEVSIFWKFRIPRVLIAFLAGATLSLSGMTFQSLFRNPLATPFVLGVSSGASLGAVLAIHCGLTFSILGIPSLTVTSFLGALLSITLVYGLSRLRTEFSSSLMLLAGVAITFSFSSLILFIQYLGDFIHSFRTIHWLMGSIDVMGYSEILTVVPFFIIGFFTILFLTHELNLMLMGDDIATSRGVDTHMIKKILFFTTSILVGSVVSVCGPISFIGMMGPHICRRLVGSNHRYLTPASVLFGGSFLVICDAFSRILSAPAEIPVGVITALLGGPFFIWLLISKKMEFNSI